MGFPQSGQQCSRWEARQHMVLSLREQHTIQAAWQHQCVSVRTRMCVCVYVCEVSEVTLVCVCVCLQKIDACQVSLHGERK